MSLLHPATKKLIANAVTAHTQTVLLVGPEGSDKLHVALQLAADLLGIDHGEASSHPQISVINSQTGAISIEQVRDLQQNLKLKTLGLQPVRRVCIVYQAGKMRHEAQNALLKTLEEPPSDTVLILTAESSTQLLPTVVSRAQLIPVLPLAKPDAIAYLEAQQIDKQEAERIFSLSQGAAGLIKALATQTGEHELTRSIAQAKLWLAAEPFQRLITSKDIPEDDIPHFIRALLRVYASGLHMSAARQATSSIIQQWSRGCDMLLAINSQLSVNPNKKLMLTRLAVEL
jgi:DNA polymerase III, delta subunit